MKIVVVTAAGKEEEEEEGGHGLGIKSLLNVHS